MEEQFFEQPANLLWPDDHGWRLATDIDFPRCTLVGCARAAVDAVLVGPALALRRQREDFEPKSNANPALPPLL